MTVQVLGTGLTGNSQLSDWLAQFSLVLIGPERSCDVETAAVKKGSEDLAEARQGLLEGLAGWVFKRGW